MISPYNGILSVGSGDPSVLLECAMTDAADVTAKSGVLQAGATISSAGVTCGSVGGIKFDMTGLSAAIKAELIYTGQVSFDVSVGHFCSDRYAFSNYIASAAVRRYIHWNKANNSGATPYGTVYQDAAKAIVGYTQITGESVLGNSDYINHEVVAIDGYVTVTISWNGATTRLYFNGVLAATAARTAYQVNLYEWLMIGAHLNGTEPATGATIRNLVISSQPVQFATHPLIANSVWYGDSFVDHSDNNTYVNGAGCIESFNSYFRKKGFKCNAVEAGVGGASVLATAANTVSSQLNGTNATKPSLGLLNLRPRIVCFRGWTNDCISLATDLAQTLVDQKAYITDALTYADYVIVGTCPSLDIRNGSLYASDADRISRVDTANSYINTLTSWWDAANPTDTGRVIVVDEFTELGGHNPTGADLENFVTADFHCNGFGHWKRGQLFARAVEQLFG